MLVLFRYKKLLFVYRVTERKGCRGNSATLALSTYHSLCSAIQVKYHLSRALRYMEPLAQGGGHVGHNIVVVVELVNKLVFEPIFEPIF